MDLKFILICLQAYKYPYPDPPLICTHYILRKHFMLMACNPETHSPSKISSFLDGSIVGKRTRREEKSDGMTCQKVNDRLLFTAFTFRLQLLHTYHSLCSVYVVLCTIPPFQLTQPSFLAHLLIHLILYLVSTLLSLVMMVEIF